MNEEKFRRRLIDRGYGDAEYKDFAPRTDGPMHAHDFAVMLLVLDGEFTLAREEGDMTFRPGDVCELAAGVEHTERTGDSGASVLLGRKDPD